MRKLAPIWRRWPLPYRPLCQTTLTQERSPASRLLLMAKCLRPSSARYFCCYSTISLFDAAVVVEVEHSEGERNRNADDTKMQGVAAAADILKSQTQVVSLAKEDRMSTDGVTLLAVLLIAAFAIERIAAGILFLLTFFHVLSDPELSENAVQRATERRKWALWHFLVSAAMVIVVLFYLGGEYRFLDALGIGGGSGSSHLPVWLDRMLLGVVLVGGSEQMSSFLKMVGAPSVGSQASGAQAVEVSGKLTLDDGSAKKETR